MMMQLPAATWRLFFAVLITGSTTALVARAPAAPPSALPAPAAAKAADKPPAVGEQRPHIGSAGRAAVLAYRVKHYVGPEMTIGDGYVDGGRGMGMNPDGSVSSSREVLTVDRSRDEQLRRELEYARSADLQKLSPLDRATRLARHVAMLYTPKEGVRAAEKMTGVLDSKYRNREVLIGDVPKITGNAGVCRHRSLMFKLLADEAGLKAALVRGCWAHRKGGQGGHAWNELHLDGKVLIVDTMNPQPDFHFPDSRSKQAARYFTVDHKPTYPAAAEPAPPKAKATKAADK